MLADALTGLFADGQDSAGGKVFFCNSGAEANEGLFKLARAWGQRDGVDTDPATARFEIITADNSFHGRTVACIAATGQDKIKAGFGPMVPGYTHVPYNDLDAARDAIGPQVGYCPHARPPVPPARLSRRLLGLIHARYPPWLLCHADAWCCYHAMPDSGNHD